MPNRPSDLRFRMERVTGIEPAWPAWKAGTPQAYSACSESCCPRVVPSTCLSGSPAAASTGGQPPPTRLARRPMAWPPTPRPRARGAPTARSSCRHRRRRLLAAGCQRRRRRSAAHPGRRPRCRTAAGGCTSSPASAPPTGGSPRGAATTRGGASTTPASKHGKPPCGLDEGFLVLVERADEGALRHAGYPACRARGRTVRTAQASRRSVPASPTACTVADSVTLADPCGGRGGAGRHRNAAYAGQMPSAGRPTWRGGSARSGSGRRWLVCEEGGRTGGSRCVLTRPVPVLLVAVDTVPIGSRWMIPLPGAAWASDAFILASKGKPTIRPEWRSWIAETVDGFSQGCPTSVSTLILKASASTMPRTLGVAGRRSA
jgi:hypothetical protein